MIPWWPRPYVDDAGLDEAALLAEIHGAAFARTWSEDDFAALLADSAVFALVVRQRSPFGASPIAGFVLVRTVADEAEILSIAVRPQRRGRGYGRLLIEEALRRLYRERVLVCHLEVERGNQTAVDLYRSLGFEAAGNRPRYYSEPASGDGTALVMRLQLR